MNAFPVQISALTFLCPEEFIEIWIAYGAGKQLAILFKGDGNRILRETVHEVNCSVNRIDNPYKTVAGRLPAAFLSQKAVIREAIEDARPDKLLHLSVRVCDKIVDSLGTDMRLMSCLCTEQAGSLSDYFYKSITAVSHIHLRFFLSSSPSTETIFQSEWEKLSGVSSSKYRLLSISLLS